MKDVFHIGARKLVSIGKNIYLEYILEEVYLGSGTLFSLVFSRFLTSTPACLSKSLLFVHGSKDLFLLHKSSTIN